MNRSVMIGSVFALLAGAINASIGIISILLMESSLKSNDVAFLKTLIACVLLFLLLSRVPSKKQRQYISSDVELSTARFFMLIAVCAFMGIFALFFFETMAYQYGNPANVVVILMASAVISATIFGAILLKEKIHASTMIGSLLAIAGIFTISWHGAVDLRMVIFGALAGSGYGVFSVLVQKFQLQGGMYLTKYLLLFGAIFLFIPFAMTYEPIHFNSKIILGLSALAVLPSILGFYCTTSALKHISASKVQVLELSEPLFAMLFAWYILNEQPTMRFWIGATLVIFGVYVISTYSSGKENK